VQGGFNFVARISDGVITSDWSFHMEVFGALFPLYGHFQPTPATRLRPYSYQVLFADVTGSTAGITYALAGIGRTTGRHHAERRGLALVRERDGRSRHVLFFGARHESRRDDRRPDVDRGPDEHHGVTFTAAGFLHTNGFDVYINGVLDLTNASAGAINNDGNDANGAGGANRAHMARAVAGGAGTTGVGNGGSASTSIHVDGGGHGRNGGSGGAGSSGAGGASGAGANIDINAYPRNLQQGDIFQVDDSTARFELSGIGAGTGGGGGGGGNGSGAGGQGAGGGGSAGRLNVFARTIRRANGMTAAGAIRAKGGKGSTGGNGPGSGRGAGGGGGGGGGGKARVVCGSLDGSAVAGLSHAPGGDGGTVERAADSGARLASAVAAAMAVRSRSRTSATARRRKSSVRRRACRSELPARLAERARRISERYRGARRGRATIFWMV
jgi:hypothetical protein